MRAKDKMLNVPAAPLQAATLRAAMALIGLLLLESAMGCQSVRNQPPADAWKLPPTTSVHRQRPLLVNYCHMDGADLQHVDRLAERLAQWDVLILFPAYVRQSGLSLAEIRRANPKIKIFAWVPLQGASDPLLSSHITPAQHEAWSCRQVDGTVVLPVWKAPIMNPYADHFGWPKAVIDYVKSARLTESYDGIMLDCLAWGPWGGEVDVDGDGVAMTEKDNAAWKEGMSFLVNSLRAAYPNTIITGNGGVPLPAKSFYYQWVNGNMHENALGNEMSAGSWERLWNGIDVAVAGVTGRQPFYFVQVDLRYDRSMKQAADATSLTPNDLRRFRLGLCTTMLRDNVYFGFDRGDCLHGQIWWFDEYNADVGAPVGPYQRDSYGPGTYSRNFDRGTVIVNISGAPVTVATPWNAINASTKQRGRNFILNPQDGCILLRAQ